MVIGQSWHSETFNPLDAELNPICQSPLAELFCGVFKFRTHFSKNPSVYTQI